MEIENKQHMSMLVQSLQLLAADYEQQVKAFPEYVHVPDEIALTFDDTYALVESLEPEGLLTPAQDDTLKQIDTLLEKMSQDENMWTCEALRTSYKWVEARKLAKQALNAFDMPQQNPNLFWLHYVPDQEVHVR